MTQDQVDNDQAGFIGDIFGGLDPFHPSRFPEGSEIRAKMQKDYDEHQEFLKNNQPMESSKMLFIDTSDYGTD